MTGQSNRILVVEDERDLAAQIAHRLESEGWVVRQAHDGLDAVSEARDFRPDAVILDLMLPGIDGLEVCRRIQTELDVPVLFLTALDHETDILVGLAVGADDYMTKPFSMRELVARVKALLRRMERAERVSSGPSSAPVGFGDIAVDRDGRRVRRAGEEVHLTPTEFDLLMCLMDNEGKVLSREVLLKEVWDWEDASGTRTVDSHIKALRHKLGPDVVRTVHGVGYAFDSPAGS